MSLKEITELRDRTSCGIKDCKKALQECDGDIEKAVEYLRKKGLAAADSKAGRSTNAGRVFSYIHAGGQVGVLLELTCETDFVANTDAFQDLGTDLCLQVCALHPVSVGRDDVPQDIVEKEKAIYKEQMADKLKGKPEEVQEKILSGKLEKFYKDSLLLEQQFVKDDSKKVEDVVKEAIATLKENITVKRFSRFQIGE